MVAMLYNKSKALKSKLAVNHDWKHYGVGIITIMCDQITACEKKRKVRAKWEKSEEDKDRWILICFTFRCCRACRNLWWTIHVGPADWDALTAKSLCNVWMHVLLEQLHNLQKFLSRPIIVHLETNPTWKIKPEGLITNQMSFLPKAAQKEKKRENEFQGFEQNVKVCKSKKIKQSNVCNYW